MGRPVSAASSSASRRSTLFINDIYGQREILRAGIVPEELVFQNPAFRPEMNGAAACRTTSTSTSPASTSCGSTPTTSTCWRTMPARPPASPTCWRTARSMMRLFPELFARHRVAPVENYPDELLATLKSVAPADRGGRADRRAADARASTTRPTTSTRSSPTSSASSWSRAAISSSTTTSSTCARPQGPKRVDVIYRRIDDDFLDPLAFRPDSALGVPGLMSRLQRRQRHARQCGRHRRRRRQGGLHLHARDREVLSRRGADPEERADLALPRARSARLRARPSRRTGGEGGARLGRLRHAGRPARRQGADRGVPREAEARPGQLHRAADAGALDLPDLRRRRRRAAPCRSAALRADRRATTSASCPAG